MYSHIRREHQENFNRLVHELEEDYKIISIFGFGSYFSDTGKRYGDVDLLIVSESNIYCKFFTVIDELIFDITVASELVIQNKISKLHQFFLRCLHESAVIVDKEGIADRLKELASKHFLAEKPPLLKKRTLLLIRSRVRTLLMDMEDNLENEVVFNLILASLVCTLRDAVCLMNDDWATTYAKNALKEIGAYLPETSAQLRKVLESKCLEEKYNISKKVSLDILSPIGGLLKQDEVIFLPVMKSS